MPCDLSVIVPVHNEQDNVRPLWDELKSVLETLPGAWEVIFVNDGSTDETAERLAQIQTEDPRCVAAHLKRNFGQTAGLAAGFDLCRGTTVITMDGDMQHDPRDIPALLAALKQGNDIASGWREERHTVDPWLRTLPSRVANGLARWVSGVQLHDFGTTFKAYRREVIDDLDLHGEMHRFIPALASQQGARIVEVPIRCRKRLSGTSHYGLARTWQVLVDLMVLKFLVSYLGRPLRAFAAIGVPLFVLGFGVALAVTIQFYFVTPLIGYGNLIFAALMMILGVQFIGMGLVAEIGARNYHKATEKKLYTLERVDRAGPKSQVNRDAG